MPLLQDSAQGTVLLPTTSSVASIRWHVASIWWHMAFHSVARGFHLVARGFHSVARGFVWAPVSVHSALGLGLAPWAPVNAGYSLQVTTNGLIATSEPPAAESHPGLFPPTFGAVAPFLADLDTSDGVGKVYYREDASPDVTRLAAECVQRGFPGVSFQPASAVVVTWEDVAPLRGPSEDPAREDEVSAPPTRAWGVEPSGRGGPGMCHSAGHHAVSLIEEGLAKHSRVLAGPIPPAPCLQSSGSTSRG